MQRHRVSVHHIERQPDIKHNPLALRFDFDAGAADFLGTTMDTKPHTEFPGPQLRQRALSVAEENLSCPNDSLRHH